MAAAVERLLADGGTLIVEAGTGTGKTYAYLVPVLLSGRRVVVSTGTRNLQDQLFGRDLPRLLAVLRVPARVSLLKGRSNYFCLHRFKRAAQLPGWRYDERFSRLERWSKLTLSGEMADFAGLPEDDPLHARVTSTADNCLGSKCADFADCFVVKARRAALAADVVVVNHHLLFADFALREEGFGEILPGAQAVIVDEAHQLPELATQFFGQRLSTRQLRDLVQDTLTETAEWGDLPDLDSAAEALSASLTPLEAGFAGLGGRETLERFHERPGMAKALADLGARMEALGAALGAYAERSPALTALDERSEVLGVRWQKVTAPSADTADEALAEGSVRWVEARGRGGSFSATPIEVSEPFARMRAAHRGAWVLTSATLSAAGDFSHLRGQLGLNEAETLALDSPFDYATQARLWVPEGLPEPNAFDYTERMVDAVLPVIEASGGGAFVLCTSHRALRLVAARLKTLTRWPLFVQGEGNRAELVEGFAAAGNAVLVGTSSFWEGVDVRGRALRVVAIDRIPFAAPGDPVFDARLAAIRATGGNPFTDHQLPEAITQLRQGVGRLIRDSTDRGLLVLCDPRLRSKGYGRQILSSLPSMPSLSRDQAVSWASEL